MPIPDRRQAGVTLVELMLAVAITSVIVLVLGGLLSTTTRMTAETDLRVRADVSLRGTMDKVQTCLLNANAFLFASSTEAYFVADMNTDPAYSSSLDSDGDGIVDYNDPDSDNDATLIVPPTAQWRIGYNLKDDDDDNNNQIDMRWKIYLATQSGIAKNTLYWDYSKNGEGWGSHRQTLLENIVTTSAFAFFGSRNDLLAPGTTGYDTNSNGIITLSEIDAVVNGGNGNGRLDTASELNAIVTVEISLSKDDNRDKKTDSVLTTEIMPPSVYLKRRP